MNPEEYLDRLIERRERGEEHLLITNAEVATILAATETLTQLRQIDVPPEFAERLELSIRARARNLARQNNSMTLPVRPQHRSGLRRSPMRRVFVSALGIAAVLLVACIGVLTVSARSLPGDSLYGVKQAENQLTLTFANQDNVSVKIDQLSGALADLRSVVNEGRNDSAVLLALNTVAAKTNDSRDAVAALPPGPERETEQQNLDAILAEEDQTLRTLLNQFDWSLRLAFTQQLGALGDAVPTVSHAAVSLQSNGTILVTLTGSHFSPSAKLTIDGLPKGVVRQSSAGLLVAVINRADWVAGRHTLGVLNPDGTASQAALTDDNPGSEPHDDNQNRHITPTPGHPDE